MSRILSPLVVCCLTHVKECKEVDRLSGEVLILSVAIHTMMVTHVAIAVAAAALMHFLMKQQQQ